MKTMELRYQTQQYNQSQAVLVVYHLICYCDLRPLWKSEQPPTQRYIFHNQLIESMVTIIHYFLTSTNSTNTSVSSV